MLLRSGRMGLAEIASASESATKRKLSSAKLSNAWGRTRSGSLPPSTRMPARARRVRIPRITFRQQKFEEGLGGGRAEFLYQGTRQRKPPRRSGIAIDAANAAAASP